MATNALPAGWSLLATRPREELHQALLTSTCERGFSDVPVDWWDESADVWRPTSIVRLLGGVWDVRRDVEVLTPHGNGSSLTRVGIANVRLSRLLTAGVSRYWIARYRRLLVLRLLEQLESSAVPDALRTLAARLHHDEAVGHDTWATAFHVGAPSDVEHLPEVPPIGETGWEPDHDGEPAALIRSAVRLLAADLLRLDAAFEDAGATAVERAAHPLLAVIAGLLLRAPVELPVSPAGSDPRRT